MPHWIKVAVIFFATAILFRIMGKKALAQMSNYDLTVALIITEILAEPLITRDVMATIWSALVLTALYLLTAWGVLKVPLLRWLAVQRPTMLIARGRVDARGLSRARITMEEFLGQVRLQGYTGPQEVEWALLEPDGQISFIPKTSARPVQPPDLYLHPAPEPSLPLQVASDGKANPAVLRHIGQDAGWLKAVLRGQQVELRQVLEGLLDDQGDLWIYLKEPAQVLHLPGVLKVDRRLFDNPFPAQHHS